MAPSSLPRLAVDLGPLAPLTVQLLLARRVRLDGDDLLSEVKARSKHEVDRLPMDTPDALGFAYPSEQVEYDDGTSTPMTHLLAYATESLGREQLAGSLQQTWHWPGAAEAIDSARATLVLSDGGNLPTPGRLDLLFTMLAALVKRLPVVAVHWPTSERLVDPDNYLAERAPRGAIGPVNVRLFRVDGSDEVVMDTLGLCALGIPDLQRKERAGSVDALGARLYSYAEYLVNKGNVIAPGHTLDGVTSRWRCTTAMSVAPPARPVLDLVDEEEPAARCPRCAWGVRDDSRWECGCGFHSNTFATRGRCPACDHVWTETQCLACYEWSPHADWYTAK